MCTEHDDAACVTATARTLNCAHPKPQHVVRPQRLLQAEVALVQQPVGGGHHSQPVNHLWTRGWMVQCWSSVVTFRNPAPGVAGLLGTLWTPPPAVQEGSHCATLLGADTSFRPDRQARRPRDSSRVWANDLRPAATKSGQLQEILVGVRRGQQLPYRPLTVPYSPKPRTHASMLQADLGPSAALASTPEPASCHCTCYSPAHKPPPPGRCRPPPTPARRPSRAPPGCSCCGPAPAPPPARRAPGGSGCRRPRTARRRETGKQTGR